MNKNNDSGILAAIGALVGQLDGGRIRSSLAAALRGEPPNGDPDRIMQKALSGEEAARILGVTRRTVTELARQGVLARVVLPGRTRAVGYLRASVEALVAGGVQ